MSAGAGDAPPARPVVFVLPSLAGGGAERVALTLAGALDRARFAPALLVLDARGPLSEAVPAGVPLHDLGHRRLRTAIPALLRALRRLAPEAIVSTLPHVNLALVALQPVLRGPVRIVLREANTPSSSLAAQPWPRAFRLAYRRLYPRANAVLAPSRRIADELRRDFAVPGDRVHLFPNPVDVPAVRAAAEPVRRAPGPGARLVAAGRLTRQKAFGRLIDAMAVMPDDAHLTLLGEGPEAEPLRARAAAAGLAARVRLPGFVAAPWPFYAGADAFVLPSRWEGMPNAALEALACGTPVIATPEAGGLAEVAEEAPPGAVILAPAGEGLNRAMAAVRPSPPAGLRPSLLPCRFGREQAAVRLAAILFPS